MKYDASMTQFHGDIAAALKLMCGKDTIAQSNADDASPAPLRDYIKSKYGNSGKSAPGGPCYFATPSKGVDIKFDGTSVTLSWSQTAKFIRDFPSEIFSEDERDEDIIPDKTALETLYNTFDESQIECPFWQTGKTLNYKGFGGIDFKCDCCDNSFCEFDKITEFLASHCHNYEDCIFYRKHKDDKSHFPCDDCGYNENTCCSYPDTPDDYCVCGDKKIPVPAQSETAVSAAFDYSILDSDTAHSLKECETVIRTETAGYFTILGAKFKEAQELLANHSEGTFEQWYTAMGFKRQTVYNLIQRFEFSSSPTIGGREEAFEALPLTLSYEISKPAAPAELVNKVLDGDITTNAEYKKLKAELEEANKQLELANFHSKQQNESFDRVADQSSKNYDKYLEEYHKNQDLMKQIRELESRPVEATFTDNSDELEKKEKEISELKEEIERLSDRKVKVFAIKLTLDEYEKLVGIVKDSNDPVVTEAVKKAQIIRS